MDRELLMQVESINPSWTTRIELVAVFWVAGFSAMADLAAVLYNLVAQKKKSTDVKSVS